MTGSVLSSINSATGDKISSAVQSLSEQSQNMDVTNLQQMGQLQMKTMILTTTVQMRSAMTKALEDALKSVTQRLS